MVPAQMADVRGKADRGNAEELSAIADALEAQLHELYAVIDPASEPATLTWLTESEPTYACLFEGERATTLAEEAPYLLRIDTHQQLTQLIHRAHDRSAVVYLHSTQGFARVRWHLRRILLVKTERGDVLYFRHYDPRIARVFLPLCRPAQLPWMFGDVVTSWFAEGEEPGQLHRFWVDDAATAVAHERLR